MEEEREYVHKMIDAYLKEKMILKAQRFQVTYTKKDEQCVVGNFQ